MFRTLPRVARALLWVRILNQLGAYALAFLAVLAGPDLAPAALAVFGVAALVSRWGGALLLDRLAPRTVIALGLGATGCALAALAAARSPAQLLIAVALVGLAFEIYEPASQELFARVTTGVQRQDAYALLGTSLVAAGAAAGVLAAVLLPLGARWLMAVDAATCLAAAAVALAFLDREPPGERVRERSRWRPPRALMRMTLAHTAFAVGYLAVIMFIPLVLLQRDAAAWVPGVTLTCAALLTPLAARLGRRPLAARAHTAVLAAGAAALGLLALLMAGVPELSLTIAIYLAWAAAGGMLLGRWQALVADSAPEAERPRWFAFHGLSWGVAQPVVPVLAVAAGRVGGGTGTGALLAAGVALLMVPLVLGARGQDDLGVR
ncbi:MFS transporter [Spirillospora sp. CA-294931]|uniref:MFS transporter n=1 Tax=Spirillospora sp. CA-294931 TaxID=3240042 RepID=UPI003D8F6DE8